MTTIVAVAGDNKVFMGADKRITPADIYRLDDAVTKIIVHEQEGYSPVYIGVSGTLVAAQALEFFLETDEVDFSSVKGIYRTMLNFRNDLCTNQLCLTNQDTSRDFAILPMNALIVNESGEIYSVLNYGEVIAHPTYAAIGSGMSFALGALHVSLQNSTPYNAMLDALSAASAFDPNTGDQYDFHEISIASEEA